MERLNEQTRWKATREDGEWLIRGKRGLIGLYPDGDLEVWVTNTHVAPQLEREGWSAEMHYDDGALFIRPYEDLDKACVAIKARRRRHMSAASRAVASERLARFRKANVASNPAREGV